MTTRNMMKSDISSVTQSEEKNSQFEEKNSIWISPTKQCVQLRSTRVDGTISERLMSNGRCSTGLQTWRTTQCMKRPGLSCQSWPTCVSSNELASSNWRPSFCRSLSWLADGKRRWEKRGMAYHHCTPEILHLCITSPWNNTTCIYRRHIVKLFQYTI